MSKVVARVGGAAGIATAIAILPAYAIGSPERPTSPDEAQGYYDTAGSFLRLNGELPLLHLLFGLIFVGVLISVLRAASGPRAEVFLALAGGAVFLALTGVGLAAEVAVPAAIMQFDDASLIEYTRPFLALSFWLYHFSQIGAAAMIFATAVVVWRTGILPKWSAVLAVLGILPLLHTWIGLPAAYSTVLWVGLTGLLLLVTAPASEPTTAAA